MIAENRQEDITVSRLISLVTMSEIIPPSKTANSHDMNGAHIYQLNLSSGGVPKTSVTTANLTTEGVAGDRQADRRYHGGPDRAVCLFSLELIEALQAEGHAIQPGSAGENLTLAGLDWSMLAPGIRLALGPDALIEITSYAAPCRTIANSFRGGDSQRISQKRYPGQSRLYARVLRPGQLAPGQPVQVVNKDESAIIQ